MSVAAELASARRRIAAARSVFVLTGAGISAESGVPTFRGAGGYWRERSFQELASPAGFAADPALVWAWYRERRRTVAACEPNAAHRALAAWSLAGRGRLVTQNVDGLHERAGHVDPIRLHGSLWRATCLSCGAERDDRRLDDGDLPASPCCGALERPAVVWFGEALPEAALLAAAAAAADADVAVAIGTSAAVWPAAGLLVTAREAGAWVIDVNPAGDAVDADLALRLPAGEAVPELFADAG